MAYFNSVSRIFYGKEMPQIYNPKSSLGQVMMFNFFKSPEKVIQVSDDDNSSITCSEMSHLMQRIAQSLHRLGFRFGDVVGFYATSSTFVAPSLFACFMLGLPVNPLDVSFNVEQIVEIFSKTKPKLVFCDHNISEKLIRALEILDSDASVVILTEKIDALIHISDLIKESEEFSVLAMDLGDSSEVCAAILCTSGSSGKPKLAQLSHAHFLQLFTINQFHEETFSLNFSSLYWLTGFSQVIYNTLNLHKRLITSKSFTTEICFDLIKKHKLKHVFLMPPHIHLFVESPRFKEADLSTIKVFSTGGLFISKQLRETLQSRLPNGKVIVAFGMTEVGGIITQTGPHDALSSSVGKPTVNTQIKILIDDGTIGGIHEIGEILVKKPMKFLGYMGEGYSSILDDEGWVHTSDMGYIDEKHEVHIVGQRSFVIKNFYNEFFPDEIESEIEQLSGVSKACVVGTPDAHEIEVPSVLVIKRPYSEITENVVIDSLNHLPPFKRIRDVFFVESLPMTSNGKLQRRKIKEMAEEMKVSSVSKNMK